MPRSDDDPILTAYLAGRDVACPSCGYSLRDCRSDRCPECGDVLRLTLARTSEGGPGFWWLLSVITAANGAALSIYFFFAGAPGVGDIIMSARREQLIAAGMAASPPPINWSATATLLILAVASLALVVWLIVSRRSFPHRPLALRIAIAIGCAASPLVLIAVLQLSRALV